MNSQDPASLQNLNDIVLPDAIGWWPLASGWYYLIGVLLLVLAWFIYTTVRSWNSNRYRRVALQQLQLLKIDIADSVRRDTGLRQIPVLLKRTALSVYPRGQIASLTGKDWLDFLNSKVGSASFTDSTVNLFDEISYTVGDLNAIETTAVNDLLAASEHWLKHHRPDPQKRPDQET